MEEYGCLIVEVRSVGDFINEIEDYKIGEFDDICFRGESKDYGETKLTSTALRYDRYPPEKMYINFYKEIHSRLTINEKENFLAFCQHHGVPTNLLDVTTNPLTALYFSCNDSIKESGFVYTFANTIDTDFSKIVSFNFDGNIILRTMMPSVINDENVNERLSYALDYLLHNELDEEIKNHDKIKRLNRFLDILDKSIASSYDDNYYLDLIEDNYIYSPLITFDRAIAQHSKFIFQFHNSGKKQILKPDYIIKIPAECKKSIISSLDKLNINKATILQDFDSIAQYIKEKYEYK